MYRKWGNRASTGNGESGRVPEMWDPGEYWEGRNPGEYRKRVESGRVPEMGNPGEDRKCGIRASTENMGSERVPGR